ncbi:MAG TPA: fused MFS/spermidine synthase [Humibacillus sp.]|nr:fused MFS/spermidine synthase [Humibacillus sp.]
MTDLVVGAPATASEQTRAVWNRSAAVLFVVTAFVGASLLFVVQPMIARLVLPSFGGSATVWSTSSLFFQVLLLAGYLYTHITTTRLGPTLQPPVHLVVLLLPLLGMPVALPAVVAPPGDSSPVWWLVRVLALTIGLPFVVVAATGPLVQRWYAWLGGPRSEDPYFIFAASNLGSFVGLLSYPFVIEPRLTLAQQQLAWSWGFALFAVLVASCGVVTWLAVRSRAAAGPSHHAAMAEPARDRRPSGRSVRRWIVLAFLPSAMMLAVTAHVSTDIASMPLLWVVPLAVYLASFILAFARTSRSVPPILGRFAVGATFAALLASTVADRVPTLVGVVLNMTMLALVSYTAHAQLAVERPPVAQLTSYYLVISLGGALGGVLNGLVAPVLFDRILEYPIVAMLVPVLLIVPTASTLRRPFVGRLNRLLVTALTGLGFVLVAAKTTGTPWWPAMLVIGAAMVIGWYAARRREIAVTLMVAVTMMLVLNTPGTLDRGRTFYGAYRVAEVGDQHVLSHGTTLHGTQFVDGRRTEPTTYYARTGPLGDVLDRPGVDDVAVIGLGAGTIAAYGRSGQTMTFIEIDPEVVRIAKDPRLFTYLGASAAQIETLVGDGRLEMEKLPERSFDLIVLDAFSSDSIPVHLLTREAMRLYESRLKPDGVIAVHISNRVLDLRSVVRAGADVIGRQAILGTGLQSDAGASTTEWVVIASPETVRGLLTRKGWGTIELPPVVWTDDYSSILSVLR